MYVPVRVYVCCMHDCMYQAFYSRLLEGAIGIGKKKDKKQASKKPLCVRSKYLLQILHAAISSTISGRCIPKCSLWFIENCGNGLQKKIVI